MTARHRPLAATLLLALLLLALQVVTAQAQSALHFGDDAAYVSFGEPGELDVDRITIEAWIMLDQDDPGVILAKPGAYYLRIDDDRLLDAGFYDHANGEDWHTVTGTTPVPLGTYHHVAFTYDGAELALYLDGAPENTSLHTGGIDPFLTNPVFAGSQMFIDDYEDYANPNDDLKTYDHEVYSIGGTAGQEIDTANDRYWFYGDNTTGFEDEAISIIKGFTGQDYIVEVDQYWLQEEGLAYISQRFDHVSNKYEVTMDLRYDDAWFDKVVDDIWYTIDNAPLPPIDTHTWHTYRSKISTLPTTNHVEIWINGDFVLEADDPDLHYEKLAILVHDHTIGPVYDIFFDNLEVWIPFKGAMDELRVFDEAVSQTDLNAWMNATVDAGHPDWDHLQGYWRFDDEANPTLDYSPNNNPGFITAATFVESGVGEDVPVCALSTDSLDFGTVLVGEAAVDSFTVTNVGDGELVGTVDVTCTGYALLSGGGAYSLLADESHTVVVEFAPPDVGAYPCTVETGSVTCGDVDCTGAGDVPPVCLVAPMSLDFGTIQVGEAVEDTFTITNDSGGELVGTVEADCPAYALLAGGGAYSLFAGETHTVIVEFAPGDVGPFPCIVTTGCDDVVCTGAGGEPPVCLVAPLSLDFGVVPAGDAPVDTFTISNDGGGELVGTVEADCPAYALLEGGGAYSLLAGEIHTVIVEFAPVDAGVFPCTVTTGCDDVACAGEGVLGPPAILAIEDIGNDQGRSVRLSIARAAADAEGLTLPVLQYEAFRRIDPLPGDEPRAGAALAERGRCSSSGPPRRSRSSSTTPPWTRPTPSTTWRRTPPRASPWPTTWSPATHCRGSPRPNPTSGASTCTAGPSRTSRRCPGPSSTPRPAPNGSTPTPARLSSSTRSRPWISRATRASRSLRRTPPAPTTRVPGASCSTRTRPTRSTRPRSSATRCRTAAVG